MEINKRVLILASAYMMILTEMFILPFFGSDSYSIIRNTVNELGSQYASNAWIVNSTIILLATGSLIAGWYLYEHFVLQRFMLILFAVSITLTAVFNACPIYTNNNCNIQEDFIHDYFSGTAFSMFVILSISTALVLEEPNKRLIAVGTGMLVMLLAILNCEFDVIAGVWQRLLFIVSFGWMIYTYK